jgi:uncharacterized protein YxjI
VKLKLKLKLDGRTAKLPADETVTMAHVHGAFAGIELTDDRYTVEQALARSRYEARDASGEVVLRARKKRLSIKDRFPFQNADGDDVFEVASASAFDFDRKRDYVVIDAVTDEEVVVLDRQFSLTSQKWSLRDPDGDLLATIQSQGFLQAVVRERLGPLGALIPRRFTITAPDGRTIGSIEGQTGLKDVYEVRVDADYDGPREAILATAMVVDAVEGN